MGFHFVLFRFWLAIKVGYSKIWEERKGFRMNAKRGDVGRTKKARGESSTSWAVMRNVEPVR